MLQADRILTFVDPASTTQDALDHAARVAAASNAVLHVMPLSLFAGGEGPPATEQNGSMDDTWTEAPLRAAARIAPEVVVMDPVHTADALVQRVSDQSIDLVVADTPHDRGPIPLLASRPVASMARRLDIPLFVVGHRPIDQPIRRILVPTDFSEHARSALAHAKALATIYDASIDVLHVLERPQYVALNATDMLAMSDATIPERKARRRSEAFVDSINGTRVGTEVHLDHGDAPDCIGHFVDRHSIDLVVLATHGVIGQPNHPLGTVAEKVLRRVTQPVFLTRAFGRSIVAATPSTNVRSDGATGQTPNINPQP